MNINVAHPLPYAEANGQLVTFGVEDFFYCFDEMQSLFDLHWNEIASNKESIPLAVDWAQYRAAHADGSLHLVTARHRGELVGYHWSFVRPHVRYSTTLCAFGDIYWLRPEFRLGRIGMKFLQFVEATWTRRGAKRAHVGHKLSLNLAPLYKRLGYAPSELYHTKLL